MSTVGLIVAENLARSEEDQAGLKTAGKKEGWSTLFKQSIGYHETLLLSNHLGV